MKDFPSVTVIILNYNGYLLTKKCVSSVQKSAYPNFDILIVDNSSTDDSFIKLKKIYSNIKNISLVHTPFNNYFTGGFNYGAKHAVGQKIILLSNDITVDPYWIDELMSVATQNPKYLVQPKILRPEKNTLIDNVGGSYSIFGIGRAIGRNEIDSGQYDKPLILDYVSATIFLVDRKFFLSLGGYDEWYRAYYEDIDFCLRARKRGATCHLAWKSKVYHQGSVTYKKYVASSSILFDIRKNRVRTILKNFVGVEGRLRLLALLLVHISQSSLELLTLQPKRSLLTIRATLTGLYQSI